MNRRSLLISFAAFLIFFLLGALRHWWFQSSGLDLAFFENAVWLIANRHEPFSTIINRPVLADHGALILYPLALFYSVIPSAYTLIGFQAFAFAVGGLLSYHLARRSGLSEQLSWAVNVAYLCHPLLFNVALFDFHPDAFIVPCMLGAILASLHERAVPFIVALMVALSCKEVASFAVIGCGIWLTVERRFKFGLLALVLGSLWFITISSLIIPWISGGQLSSGIERYAYLGRTPWEIVTTIVSDPGKLTDYLSLRETVKYLLELFIPVAWGISRRGVLSLVGALPLFVLNLLSSLPLQRDFRFQYSLPLLPFLILMSITSLSSESRNRISSGMIMTWSIGATIAIYVAGVRMVGWDYPILWLPGATPRSVLTDAVALIPDRASLLTTNYLAPHLAQRSKIQLLTGVIELTQLSQFDYVLINTREPMFPKEAAATVAILSSSNSWEPIFGQDGVFGFKRTDKQKNR